MASLSRLFFKFNFMVKKIIWIIVIIFIFAAGGFLWRNFQQANLNPTPDEGTKNEAKELLLGLKENTGIAFSEIMPIKFQWNSLNDEMIVVSKIVNGWSFEKENTTAGDAAKIDEYFQEAGFVIDEYNIASGAVGSLTGYKKGQIVCQVSSLAGLNNQGHSQGSQLMDLSVNCAKVDFDPSPELAVEFLIKKLLAEKYEKEINEVDLENIQKTKNHFRGMVVFQPDGSENTGLVLAAKTNDGWQLVFDGNGSFSCYLLEEYDFPEEMRQGCVSEPELENPISN